MRGAWYGDGAPVALLHGQPGRAADWELVVAQLAGRYRLFVPDRRGYDRTPAGGLWDNARDLLGFLDRPTVVVGHSLGGGIALAAALLDPELAAGLVLVSSVGSRRALTRTDRLLSRPGLRWALPQAASWLGPRMVPVIRWSSGRRLDATQLDLLAAAMTVLARTGGWEAFAVEQAAFVREADGLARRLDEIRVPAAVVVGRRDRMVSPRAQLDLAAQLRAATVHEVDGGHLLPIEAPEAVADAVGEVAGRAGLR